MAKQHTIRVVCVEIYLPHPIALSALAVIPGSWVHLEADTFPFFCFYRSTCWAASLQSFLVLTASMDAKNSCQGAKWKFM